MNRLDKNGKFLSSTSTDTFSVIGFSQASNVFSRVNLCYLGSIQNSETLDC